MKFSKGIIAAVSVLVVAVFSGFYYWTTTPEYSLLKIKDAIESHDSVLFNKHVDVETVVSRGVDVIFEQSMANDAGSASGAEALGSKIAAGMLAMMKPKIVEYATNKINIAIEGTTNKGDESKPVSGKAASLKNIESFFGSDSDLKQSYVRKEGNIAYFGLERFDEKLQDTITLEFKLRKNDGYWQVIEASNLREMLQRLEKLKEKRLSEINAPIQKQLDASISVAGVGKKNVQANRWKKQVLVGVLVKNNLDEVIEDVVFQTDILDDKGNTIHTLKLSATKLPKAFDRELVWTFDINEFIKADKRLLQLPEGQLKYSIKVLSLELSDGKKITTVSSL